MSKGIWIRKERLTEVLTIISVKAGTELSESMLDEVIYSLIGTSDEVGNWLDLRIGNVSLRMAVDGDDNDIVHIHIEELDDEFIDGLSFSGSIE